MQLNRVDPQAESPRQAGRRFRVALRLSLLFIALLWTIFVLGAALDLGLQRWGVRPGQAAGLLGLLTMPLLHGGPQHLVHNSLPALLLGCGLLFFYSQSAWRVLPWLWLGPPLFVWLVGETGSTHFGASGLNFGLLGYLAVGGLLRRDAGTLALSLAVMFYYGGMLSGVLPVTPGVSWEGHLGGLIVGVMLAVVYRRWDVPPRRRYQFEDEEDPEDEDVADWNPAESDSDDPTRPPTLH